MVTHWAVCLHTLSRFSGFCTPFVVVLAHVLTRDHTFFFDFWVTSSPAQGLLFIIGSALRNHSCGLVGPYGVFGIQAGLSACKPYLLDCFFQHLVELCDCGTCTSF